MKQGKIIDAYKALNKLSAYSLPIKTAYALHNLRTALKSAWDFQCEEEGKLIERLNPTIDDNGDLVFKNWDDKQEFLRIQKELAEQEQEIDYQPVTVGLLDGITLSANDIYMLDGFVKFEVENNVHS